MGVVPAQKSGTMKKGAPVSGMNAMGGKREKLLYITRFFQLLVVDGLLVLDSRRRRELLKMRFESSRQCAPPWQKPQPSASISAAAAAGLRSLAPLIT